MHFPILVTIKKGDLRSSAEAREAVLRYLLDEGFVEQGRFSASWGDWCVIGGRFSGYLSEPDPEGVTGRDGPRLAPRNGRAKAHSDVGDRDDYREVGYDDDACLVTRCIYNRFLKRYVGKDEAMHEFLDADEEEVGPSFIGAKWLVVIDLHC